MKSKLRILHLEDDANDAALVLATLEAEAVICTITCVQNQHDYVAALEWGGIDLILSDHSLPAFDGLSALSIAHARWPEIPLIFVSGTLGEERAIESLKSGATDYILKGRLARLVPAVRRAMQEVAARAERQRLEVQFIESQKMDAIGQLASGVAHDFNNMLAVIIGCNDMLAMKLGEDHPVRKYNNEIRHASERAVGLTRQLLVFSRKEMVQSIVLDFNEVVVDLDKMLQRLIDENIAMTIIPGKNVGRIKADAGYVGQVLMNLVINARDAMPNGGKLKITTSNVTLNENDALKNPNATAGEYVMLSVSDTGTGMSDEVKARLFEAFFTTKPKGKGTGLGLVTCQTIVQQSGGYIGVSSKLGKGTTFYVYFPRVEQPIHHTPRLFPTGPLPCGTETLLLVEDEPAVRQLTHSVLEAQGYQVLSASNGQDALKVVSEHKGEPIRLVFTDVIMPLMGGKVMAEYLIKEHPDLKILFTSGYTDDTIIQHGVLEPGAEFLRKPYSPAALTRRVRDMLDASKN